MPAESIKNGEAKSVDGLKPGEWEEGSEFRKVKMCEEIGGREGMGLIRHSATAGG